MKTKFLPLQICNLTKLTEENLKWTRTFVPNLRTLKNRYDLKDTGYQFHTCYVIINLITGKPYFGKHTFSYDPKKIGYSVDYWGTSKHLHNSIRKYGMDNFRMLILKYFKTGQLALDYEKELITLEMIRSEYCYNLQGGGKGLACGEFSSIHARIKDGTHPWLARKDGTSVSSDRVKNGTCILLKRKDGTSVSKDTQTKNVLNGTHNMLKRADGSCLGGDTQRRRVKEGTQHCLGRPSWESPKTTEINILTWSLAQRIYTEQLKNPLFKTSKLKKHCQNKFGVDLSGKSISTMRSKFSLNWVPNKDNSWLDFKQRLSFQWQGSRNA